MEAYREADVFLFPTWEREPFGLAPVEAAAQGCVPVITAACGVAEFMTHGSDCLKVERSASALAFQMKALCKGEVPLEQIGAGAQALTRGLLSFDACVAQIESVLAQVVARTGRPCSPTWQDHALAQLKHDLAQKKLFARRSMLGSAKERAKTKFARWKSKRLQANSGFWCRILRGLIKLRLMSPPA
jgi:hypothetical protein